MIITIYEELFVISTKNVVFVCISTSFG